MKFFHKIDQAKARQKALDLEKKMIRVSPWVSGLWMAMFALLAVEYVVLENQHIPTIVIVVMLLGIPFSVGGITRGGMGSYLPLTLAHLAFYAFLPLSLGLTIIKSFWK